MEYLAVPVVVDPRHNPAGVVELGHQDRGVMAEIHQWVVVDLGGEVLEVEELEELVLMEWDLLVVMVVVALLHLLPEVQ
jgi:hypothetical protein